MKDGLYIKKEVKMKSRKEFEENNKRIIKELLQARHNNIDKADIILKEFDKNAYTSLIKESHRLLFGYELPAPTIDKVMMELLGDTDLLNIIIGMDKRNMSPIEQTVFIKEYVKRVHKELGLCVMRRRK